jgi:hypothetical protein
MGRIRGAKTSHMKRQKQKAALTSDPPSAFEVDGARFASGLHHSSFQTKLRMMAKKFRPGVTRDGIM